MLFSQEILVTLLALDLSNTPHAKNLVCELFVSAKGKDFRLSLSFAMRMTAAEIPPSLSLTDQFCRTKRSTVFGDRRSERETDVREMSSDVGTLCVFIPLNSPSYLLRDVALICVMDRGGCSRAGKASGDT